MLASLADAPLQDPHLVYEPKYDGIRAIAEITYGGRVSVRRGPVSAADKKTRPLETRPPYTVRLWSRLGNEKTHQFPEITAALERWAAKRKAPAPSSLILDGEIVAVDADGRATGFQQLQGRIHLLDESAVPATGSRARLAVAFIAFDILREDKTDLRGLPLSERRAALERVFGRTGSPLLRISEMVQGDGRALYRRALDEGWEGLIAKDASSPYKSGKRTPDWRKLKIVHEQEFVIGGWTEPRQSRVYFGALLLGVYADHPDASGRRPLIYAGHTGTGFNQSELARVMKRLEPLEIKEPPFQTRPKTNERAHWVKPALVAQIKFTEWTADAKLRHPVYLGLRDDKKPDDVRREQETRLHRASVRGVSGSQPEEQTAAAANQGSMTKRTKRVGGRRTKTGKPDPGNGYVVDQLRALEERRTDGLIELPGGHHLSVSNLHKVFWPKLTLTKGDLLRYYAEVAALILPAVADRPLVMKRFPNGVAAQPFYQHRAASVPAGVRVETVRAAERRPQIVGGDLLTLLYMTQIASISQDPWFSRVATPEFADHAALDLDPADGMPFARVLDVARWIRDELATLGATGVPKTSGADGLHIYVKLPPHTPYEAGLIFCQIVATVVAQKHPNVATVERAVRARGARVYVDYLQNIQGKTLATAYSARASEYAGVSTPLTWQEVDEGVRREDFTIETVPARFRKVGDLWEALRRAKAVDLSRVARYAERAGAGRLKGDTS